MSIITTIENFASPGLVRAAVASWPDARWPHWHRYVGSHGDKYASKDAARLPTPCRLLTEQMAGLSVPGDECFPDMDLHAAGMHWIPEGGCLPLHFDAQSHPLTGWARRFNAILYLSDCIGGDLVARDCDGVETGRVSPVANRLVVLDASCRHEVEAVRLGHRLSLAVYWWSVGESRGHVSAEWLSTVGSES